MRKRVPRLKTDEEAERFLEQDLSDYMDARNLRALKFEFQPKDTQLNLRLSRGLLDAIKKSAAADGISYQKYIRMVLEHAVSRPER